MVNKAPLPCRGLKNNNMKSGGAFWFFLQFGAGLTHYRYTTGEGGEIIDSEKL